MASDINDLKARVQAAEDKVAKLESTLEKHKKRKEKKILEINKILESYGRTERYEDIKDENNLSSRYYEVDKDLHHEFYWAVCDLGSIKEAIRNKERDIADAKNVVKNAKERLGAEEAKLQYIQDSIPQIIKDFLEEWKKKCVDYYLKKAEEYPEAYKEYRAEIERIYYDLLVETVDKLLAEDREQFIKRYCYNNPDRVQRILDVLNEGFKPNNMYEYINLVQFSYRDPNDIEHQPRYEQRVAEWNARFGDGFFQDFKSNKFDKGWLNKQIEQEKNRKLVDLMNRVTKITGTITNAKYLSIENGDLNGYIEGERGKAKVQTIGAGGYNIQCYHYRVLIHEIKE